MTTHLTTAYENKNLSSRQIFDGARPAKVVRDVSVYNARGLANKH